jgi:SAM-dependent methyltransferase
MKGFVPTPEGIVDLMVEKLFQARQPEPGDSLLDPGCGTGAFILGVLRWCFRNGVQAPQIVGVESDPVLLEQAQARLGGQPAVRLDHRDFLGPFEGQFDYVIGNPPYVPITDLSADEKASYRRTYLSATGRFDLYLLFFEQAIRLLKRGGRLVFVTPEKFLYVQTAESLRRALVTVGVEEIHLIPEETFGDLVTYPTITTLRNDGSVTDTSVRLRNGVVRELKLPASGSWQPSINGNGARNSGPALADVFLRISCGVATGADDVYVLKTDLVPDELRRFAWPTVSGRGLISEAGIRRDHSMLIPYDRNGILLPEARLGPLETYLREAERFSKLVQRTCVARKPWYAFHENPPLPELLRPKILCKDIGSRPHFLVDQDGDIVPRHSVYYLVPSDSDKLHELCEYLNSPAAIEWLEAHCQRAANGFYRLQSHVLKHLPIPERFLSTPQLAYS